MAFLPLVPKDNVPIDHSIALAARRSLSRLLANPGCAKPDPDAEEEQDDKPKHQNRHTGSSGRLDVRRRRQDGLRLKVLRVVVRAAVRCAVTGRARFSHASACSRGGRPRETPYMGHARHDSEMSANRQNPESRDHIARKETEGEDKYTLGACQETD